MPRPEWLAGRRTKEAQATDGAMWTKCPKCGEVLYRRDLAANLFVCTRCGYHFRMKAYDRIASIVDGEFTELGADVLPGDPLDWSDRRSYPAKLKSDRERSGLSESVVCGFAFLGGRRIALGVMDFHFRGGTMGTVVGERVTLLLEEARKRRIPCIIVTASGGARMEEGMFALMQMARTTVAVRRLRAAKLPYIVVLANPTTGGVTASYAMLGDVHIAEPGAVIGFAGARVIEQTIRERLPEGFQRAEYLRAHGMVDLVVPRPRQRETLARLCRLLARVPTAQAA